MNLKKRIWIRSVVGNIPHVASREQQEKLLGELILDLDELIADIENDMQANGLPIEKEKNDLNCQSVSRCAENWRGSGESATNLQKRFFCCPEKVDIRVD